MVLDTRALRVSFLLCRHEPRLFIFTVAYVMAFLFFALMKPTQDETSARADCRKVR